MKPRASNAESGPWVEEPVAFRVDGEQVVGMYHHAKRTPAPGVLMLHGFRGNKQEAHRLFVIAARRLARAGFGVLRFDFRGSGDSEGDFSGTTVGRQLADARAALAWLRDRPGIDAEHVAVIGLSLGGMIAAFLLGEAGGPEAGVLWAPVARPADAVRRHAKQGEVSNIIVGGKLDMDGWPVSRRFVLGLLRRRPLKAIRKAVGPVLLIHGDADDRVPLDDSRAYEHVLRTVGVPVELYVVRGSGHTFDSLDWQEEVIARTEEWLRRVLG